MAGPPEQVGVAPEDRQGLLWDTYRKLAQDGFRLDAAGYSTAFRVKLKVCYPMLNVLWSVHVLYAVAYATFDRSELAPMAALCPTAPNVSVV